MSLFGIHLFYTWLAMTPLRRPGSNEVQKSLTAHAHWGRQDYSASKTQIDAKMNSHTDGLETSQIDKFQPLWIQRNMSPCSLCGQLQQCLQQSTLNVSDGCTIIDSALRSASVFHYLFLSKTGNWNVKQFTHNAKNSIRGEGAIAGLLPSRKYVAGPGGKRRRWHRICRSIGILIVQMGYKALFVCPCSSDLFRATE